MKVKTIHQFVTKWGSFLIVLFLGLLISCGGNLVILPWTGFHPDSQINPIWYKIWGIELIIIFLVSLIYFVFYYNTSSQVSRIRVEKNLMLILALVFFLVFVSPILAGITSDIFS